jgi:hypothetical protein
MFVSFPFSVAKITMLRSPVQTLASYSNTRELLSQYSSWYSAACCAYGLVSIRCHAEIRSNDVLQIPRRINKDQDAFASRSINSKFTQSSFLLVNHVVVMAAFLISTILLLLHKSRASPITTSNGNHINEYCKQFTIPVFATSESAGYDLPRVDNDIEAAFWAIHTDTWSTPAGPFTVLKNTTTSGTFNIYAQLCVPKSAKKNNVLQIATHGAHYDSRYWDPKLEPENSSYVEAALKAGYSIFTYDRLGTGHSDHPDAYEVVQSPLELEILHQLDVNGEERHLV